MGDQVVAVRMQLNCSIIYASLIEGWVMEDGDVG